MTQSEYEQNLALGYANYVKMEMEAHKAAKALEESMINFYRNSNGAIILNDYRLKKMINNIAEFNKHTEEFLMQSQDDIQLIGITLSQIEEKLKDAGIIT